MCVCVWCGRHCCFGFFVDCLLIGRSFFFFFFESVVIRDGLGLLGLLGKLLAGRGGDKGCFTGKCVNCFIGG